MTDAREFDDFEQEPGEVYDGPVVEILYGGPNTIPDPRDFAVKNNRARFRHPRLAREATPADVKAVHEQLVGFVMLRGAKAPESHGPLVTPDYEDPELPLLTKPWAASSKVTVAGEFIRDIAPAAVLALGVGAEMEFSTNYTVPHYYTDVPIPEDPYDLRVRDIKHPRGLIVNPRCYFDSVESGVAIVSFHFPEGSAPIRSPEAGIDEPELTGSQYVSPRDCWAMSMILDALVEVSPDELARHASMSAELVDYR